MAAATAALLVGTLISTGYAAYSQNQAGKNEEAIMKRNAQQLRIDAEGRAAVARENTLRADLNADRAIGSMRARLASQGGVLSTGADLDIMGDTAAALQLEVLDAANSASAEYSNAFKQAEVMDWQGKIAKKVGQSKAAGTLLSGLTEVAGKGYNSYQSGSLLGK